LRPPAIGTTYNSDGVPIKINPACPMMTKVAILPESDIEYKEVEGRTIGNIYQDSQAELQEKILAIHASDPSV